MENELKIEEISISNTFGCEQLTFAPGTVTIISGQNGTGKSSVLNSISYLFEANSDPGVIKNGAKASVVRMRLSNGLTIQKKTTPSRGTMDWDGPSTTPAKDYVAQLGRPMAINPAELLAIDASNKPGRDKLTKALLNVMPIEFSEEEILSATADHKLKHEAMRERVAEILTGLVKPSAALKVMNLDAIAKIRKVIYDARTDIGRAAEEANSAVAGLEKNLPPATDAKESKIKLASIDVQIEEISAEVTTAKVDAEKQYNLKINEISANCEARIEAARKAYQSLVDGAKQDRAEQARIIEAAHGELLTSIATGEAEATEGLKTERAVLVEQIAASNKAAGARETMETMRVRAQQKDAEYKAHGEALAILDAAKKTKLDALPIQGFTFDDGEVLFNGVAWHMVNLASRVMVILQMMTRMSGKLSFIILDDSEHLDPATKEALLDGLRDAGYQTVMAEVTADPLTVQVMK